MSQPAEEPVSVIAPPSRLSWSQSMFRRFISGVLFLLPAVLTIAVVYQIYLLVNHWIIEPIALLLIPEDMELLYWDSIKAYVTPPLALSIVLIIFYLAGYLFQTRIRIWLDWMFSHVPGVSTIYKALLDVSQAYQGPDGLKKIDRVVLVPFPTERSRMAAYLMSECRDEQTGEELICAYIPLGLFPPTGYTVIYPRSEVIITDWPATDGWKILLSAGLTLPAAVPFSSIDRSPPVQD